jgi:hypothetical protein
MGNLVSFLLDCNLHDCLLSIILSLLVPFPPRLEEYYDRWLALVAEGDAAAARL